MPDTSRDWRSLAQALLAGFRPNGSSYAVAIAGFDNIDPGVVERLRDTKIDRLSYAATDTCPPAAVLYDAAWDVQRQVLDEVVGALSTRGVTPLVFKGAELFSRELGEAPVGLLADIDILVDPLEVEPTREVLAALGFRQDDLAKRSATWRNTPADSKARYEEGHYELYPYRRLDRIRLDDPTLAWTEQHKPGPVCTRDGVAYLLVTVDVHHALSVGIPGDAFRRQAHTETLPGALVPASGDHLWFIAARYYMEVATDQKRSLREMVYLRALLERADLDWDDVTRAVRQRDLRSSLYYVLAWLARLRPGGVPPEVLAATDPRLGSRQHDYGWQLGKLFDVIEPFPLG